MTTKYTRSHKFAPDPNAPKRCCDMPGCNQAAGYRAPKSRKTLNSYYWFCLDHIKSYNKNWDFYKGMTPDQIEAQIRSASVWDKPSWRLGHLGKTPLLDQEQLKDPLNIFSSNYKSKKTNKKSEEQNLLIPFNLRKPLNILGLSWPISLEELSKRYKILAHKHHPDKNGGNLQSEERFKSISIAYSELKAHLMNSPLAQ